eukprot:gene20433-27221_t
MIYSDCNNKAQGVWWQDFPLKSGALPKRPTDWHQINPHCPNFGRDLAAYSWSLHLPSAAAEKLQQLTWEHDFSSARAYLVPSTPGYHTDRKMLWSGHMRVRTLLAKEHLPDEFRAQAPQIAAQFSSLGSVDSKWLLQEFGASLATCDRSAGPCPGASGSGTNTKASPSGPSVAASDFHLVWPTLKQVKGSIEGWVAGYSLPGGAKNILKDELQQYMCKYDGALVGRERVMPHMKTFTRFQGSRMAWVIVSSHNLSKAAWGQLQKKNTQLMVRSYELGVLVLPSLEEQYRRHEHYGFSCTPGRPYAMQAEPKNPTDVQAGTQMPEFYHLDQFASDRRTASSVTTNKMYVPLPYSLPPRRYTTAAGLSGALGPPGRGQEGRGAGGPGPPRGEVDIPWCGEMPHQGLDCLGQEYGRPAQFYDKVEPSWN